MKKLISQLTDFRRVFFIFLLIIKMFSCAFAGTTVVNGSVADGNVLSEKLYEVRSALDELNYFTADSLLSQVEAHCEESASDSVRISYYELRSMSLFNQKLFNECIPYLNQTIKQYEKINLRSTNYLEKIGMLGFAYQKTRQLDEAEKCYRKGLMKSMFISPSKDYQSACYLNLGTIYLAQGDSVLANECFQKISTEEPFLLPDGSLSGDELVNTIWADEVYLFNNAKYEECATMLGEQLSRFKSRFGTKYEDYVKMLYHKALLLDVFLDRKEEAVPLFEEAIALRKQFPHSEDIAGCYIYILRYLASQGDSLRIKELVSDAFDYLDSLNSVTETKAKLCRYIGDGAFRKSHYHIAITYYEMGLNLDHWEPDSSHLINVNMLSVAYILTGHVKQAKLLLSKLLTSCRNELDSIPDLKSQVLHNYGRSLLLSGEKSSAIEYLKESNNLYREMFGEDNSKTIQYIKECNE